MSVEIEKTNDSESIDVAALKPDELSKVTIRELVPRTFEDGSRIHDVTKTAALFEDVEKAIAEWRDNYRTGKRLSRRVAIALVTLRRAVTDINGDPLWAVKGLTAWKVIYAERVAAMYESLGMSEPEIKALSVAVKGYIADRNLVVVGMAQRAIETTPLLAAEKWTVNKEEWTVGKVVDVMQGDDQSAAALFEGKTFPPKLAAAIEVERKRQKHEKGTKKGQFKQGFEKKATYFGPTLASRNPADKPEQPKGEKALSERLKGHSDAMIDATGSGNVAILAQILFVREQLAAINAALLKTAKPKGGNVPAIVENLDALATEAKLLADYKRPGDHAEPTKEKVAAASIKREEK